MCGKTKLLIEKAREHYDNKTCLIKPKIDTRSTTIASRNGEEIKATILLDKDESLKDYINKFIVNQYKRIYVDEVQFLSPKQIYELFDLWRGRFDLRLPPVDVECFGLRTSFDGVIWESVKILFSTCSNLVEIPTQCSQCERKAIFSNKKKDVETNEDKVKVSWFDYEPSCERHFTGTFNEN